MKGKELMVQDHSQVVVVHQADNDHQVLTMWLNGRPHTTKRAYAYEAQRMMAEVANPLQTVTLGDLQRYFSTLAGLSPASRARAINAVKSLFAFAQRIGYLAFNPGAAIRSPKNKNALSGRILTEPQVHRMLTLEPQPRNRILLRLLYAAGLRVSEVCALKWRDLQKRDGAGQISVYGKGGKTRGRALVWGDMGRLNFDQGGRRRR